MKLLIDFDSKDYSGCRKRYFREAVRAIIIRGNRIALVKSEKEGFYKVPGGRIEDNETHLDTLIRETLEETGLRVIPESVREFGIVREKRRGYIDSDEVFEQKSYYYFAEVEDDVSEPSLTENETALKFVLEWVPIQEAYDTNMTLCKNQKYTFLIREAAVLELLRESLIL